MLAFMGRIEKRGMDVAQDFLFSAEGEGGRACNAGAKRHVANGGVLRQLWPGTDEAHVSAEDVVELRQFVELELAENAAEGRDAAVTIAGEAGTGIGSRGRDHGTEFVNAKQLPLAAHPWLDEEHRTARRELDEGGDGQHREGENQENEQRNGNVEETPGN
jgi:hypothetical protein